MNQYTFKIKNMKCDGCVNTINQNLGAHLGIINIEADLEKKTLTVVSDDTFSKKRIAEMLNESGYPVESTPLFSLFS